jgi:trans-aconitate methyltransferase
MSYDGISALYRVTPKPVQLHVNLRLRLFPFDKLLEYIPTNGTIVDLGCGHGVWIFYLARRYPRVSLIGVDPDQAKIKIATEIAAQNKISNTRFITGYAEKASLPECDLVSLIDVMYLIPYDEQYQIIETAVSALKPSGRILVKEMDSTPRWKYAWNWMEEVLAVRLFNITVGDHFYFRSVPEWIKLLTQFGLTVKTKRIDQGYLHPHVLLYGVKG